MLSCAGALKGDSNVDYSCRWHTLKLVVHGEFPLIAQVDVS